MNDDEMLPAPPPSEDELPPPPSDIAKESKQFGELKIKKRGPFAGVRRSFTIFGKDLSTMAKHGLLSSVILFIFLALVFYIMSFTMEQALQMDFGEGEGDGEDGPGIPKGSEVNPPVAHLSVTPLPPFNAGTMVTLDSSASTDFEGIVFYVWDFDDGYQDVTLFGETVQHVFRAVGTYEVHLTVVDADWNLDEVNTTINVQRATSDFNNPNPAGGMGYNVNVTETLMLDASSSTDDVEIVDYTWIFDDGITRVLNGMYSNYTFDNAGSYNIDLIVRDAAGNIGKNSVYVQVASDPEDTQWPEARSTVPNSVSIGDTVELDASDSTDNMGISSYTWYIEHNGTVASETGMQASFDADEFGPYEITLVVRDNAGNVNTWDGTVIALPADMTLNEVSWTSTPFGTDISFNLLTYSYGIALLASVIFIGGLFAKGFTHEITKGTIKVLFFGPISVTTMTFSKILYPLLIGPLLIFPVVAIGLLRFNHPYSEVFMITLVSYAFAAVTMVSAAYGSSLLYLATKKMVLKPSTISRMFLYFSLIVTLTVFEWMSFLLDTWQQTDMWSGMYESYGGIAVLSPFHQGGMILSNMLVGTNWTLDLWVFAIPAILIVGGVLASRKLYGDIFSKE
jgi:PKD repeat protein